MLTYYKLFHWLDDEQVIMAVPVVEVLYKMSFLHGTFEIDFPCLVVRLWLLDHKIETWHIATKDLGLSTGATVSDAQYGAMITRVRSKYF